MSDFNVRSDSVNVEQIMEQIRARIREKRGADYTEAQIHELANVKLEKFLDPRGVRSDLLAQFRQAQPPYSPPDLPNYAFEENTLFESHRGPLRFIRRLLSPILKLFFNPNPLIQALNIQSRLNTMAAEREATREATRHTLDQLQYEVLHNLVVETTRMGIEVKNLKMRVESLASRLEFNERRARALESVVVYKPGPEDRAEAPTRELPAREARQPERESRHSEREWRQPERDSRVPERESRPPEAPRVAESAGQPPAPVSAAAPGAPQQGEGPGQRSRRRRRRRGRRGGGSAAAIMAGGQNVGPAAGGQSLAPGQAGDAGHEPAPAGPDLDDASDEGPDTDADGAGPFEPEQ